MCKNGLDPVKLSRLQFFSLIALLIFVLPPEGFLIWIEKVNNTWRTLLAIIYAFPLFILLNSIVAIFKSFSEVRKLGVWVKNRFVFHEPQHIKTVVVTDEDNGKLIPFKVTGLPKDSSVDLKVKIEKGFDDRNVRVQFIGMKEQPIIWDKFIRHNMLAFVPEDELFYITTSKQTPSNDSTIKVYLVSWYAKLA